MTATTAMDGGSAEIAGANFCLKKFPKPFARNITNSENAR